MREAVGGSLLLYLIIPIIIIFIVFIGFIMNYASAYRAANYMITQIENCQGRFDDCGGVDMKLIKSVLKTDYAYIASSVDEIRPCYIENNDSYVFRVNLPVSFDIPLVGASAITSVKAETKSIPNVPKKALDNFTVCK